MNLLRPRDSRHGRALEQGAHVLLWPLYVNPSHSPHSSNRNFALCSENIPSEFAPRLHLRSLPPMRKFYVYRLIIASGTGPMITPLPARSVKRPAEITEVQEATIALSHRFSTCFHLDQCGRSLGIVSRTDKRNGASDGIRTRGPQNHNLML